MRRALFAVMVLGLVIALHAPASAGITGATLTSPAPTFTGPCPASISFNGSITGTAGTKFLVTFNRFIDGVQQISDKGMMTMPPAGSLAVSENISIPASTTAPTFDQIWVHGIAGQTDVYSNKVNFSVTCAAPPTPTPPLAAPTNFKATTDPGECADHVAPLFGGLICGGALKDGDLVVIWNYADPSTVDGFRIFDTTGGAHTQIDTQSGMTGKALKIKAADAKNKCYVVRAYKGSSESADSNSYCTGAMGLTTIHHMNLPVNGYRFTDHFSHEWENATYCFYTRGLGGRDIEVTGQQMLAGFTDFWDPGTNPFPCYEKIDHAYSSAIRFDMSPLNGKKLWKAVLSFTNQKTDSPTTPPVTCLAHLMLGTSDWTGAKDLIGGDAYHDLPTGTGINVNNSIVHITNSTNFQIDVTDAVRDWLAGSKPNWGFVFRGGDEAYARDNNECASFYGNVTLGVDYFG